MDQNTPLSGTENAPATSTPVPQPTSKPDVTDKPGVQPSTDKAGQPGSTEPKTS